MATIKDQAAPSFTPGPWKPSFVRWTHDAPIMGFAIRPAEHGVLTAKRGGFYRGAKLR